MIWKVKAVRSPTLSTKKDPRYVLIDKDTGEIVDDCQGYGFKTEKKAYACWAYQNRDKKLERKIKRWLKSHKDFVRKLDYLAFDIVKSGFDFGIEDVENLLYEEDIKVDFPVKDLYYIWKRGN